MLILLYALPTILYCCVIFAVVRAGLPRSTLKSLLAAAVAAHAMTFIWPIASGQPAQFGFAHAVSIMLCAGAGLLWLESLQVDIDLMWLMVLPVAAIVAPLPYFFGGVSVSIQAMKPLFVPHLIVGMLAYSFLAFAALHAVLMIVAERQLQQQSQSASAAWQSWTERLPPLLVMEKYLFRVLFAGFVLLTLTVLTGVVFSEEVFGKPWRLDHKTIFTVVSWLTFGTLLVGRRIWGWRGRLAARFTLWGFLLVFMAYIGSRFVLEVILHRF